MEFRQIQTFMQIAQVKNFSKTAELLGYSQSAVTVQIRQLETELGVRLFDRTGKKVILTPFMIVAGDHARNDMSGDDEDSWKNQFLAAGYDVECRMKGLGEYPAIQSTFC